MIRMLSMKSTYTVSEAQSQLPRLLRSAEAGSAIAIRRRDDTVAYVLSREHLEALVETLEIMANPEAMRAITAHRGGKTKFRTLSALVEPR